MTPRGPDLVRFDCTTSTELCDTLDSAASAFAASTLVPTSTRMSVPLSGEGLDGGVGAAERLEHVAGTVDTEVPLAGNCHDVPPLKSMPSFSPPVRRAKMPASRKIAEIVRRPASPGGS